MVCMCHGVHVACVLVCCVMVCMCHGVHASCVLVCMSGTDPVLARYSSLDLMCRLSAVLLPLVLNHGRQAPEALPCSNKLTAVNVPVAQLAGLA